MGLIRGMARTAVVAGTATAVSNRVSRRQAERWQQQEYEQQAPYAAPPPPAPAAPVGGGGGDMTAELERLASLRNQGVLTDAEFAAAKAKLLGI
ncbi:MAG TPA: SHOCT domain-containing protein [Acidimicrobiales bacterium]|nr:SHOCT domain-containing protein [Acidimicrobiales bacterium]